MLQKIAPIPLPLPEHRRLAWALRGKGGDFGIVRWASGRGEGKGGVRAITPIPKILVGDALGQGRDWEVLYLRSRGSPENGHPPEA